MSAANPFADLQPQSTPAPQSQGAPDGGNPFAVMAASSPQQPQESSWLDSLKRGTKAAAGDIAGMAKGIIQQNPISQVYNDTKHAYENYQSLKNGGQTAEQQQNADEQAAGYGTMYRRVAAPIAQGIGVNVSGMEQDAAQGNTAGVVGHAVAPLAAAAITHGAVRAAGAAADVAGRVKNNLVIPDEVKAAAATKGAASADIHAQAAQGLQARVAPALDAVARDAGVDTSATHSLSEKAEVAGRAYRKQAQATYSQLDDAAQAATGQPGRFQDLAGNIRTVESALQDPMLSATERQTLQERLQNAQTQYESFKQEMVKAGLDESLIKKADKSWAQGAALDEVSRGFLTNEDTAGHLKPSARPLDAPVKKFTAAASPRGHILKQALGDHAGVIQDATTGAARDVIQSKAAAKATNDAAKVAQERIAKVSSNRKTVGKGAAAALGLGYAASKSGDVYRLLSSH
jgi:hypothetical protein